MSDAIPVTYDIRRLDPALTAIAGLTDTSPQKGPARRARRPAQLAYAAAGPIPARQLREDPEDYVANREARTADELSRAADEHTKGLLKAMHDLDEARNLLAVLIASMEAIGDSRAMQAETVLTIVEKKLDKARTRIDQQESRHRKFFLAHAEARREAEANDGGEG